jgi:15-cis-phytoene synthase
MVPTAAPYRNHSHHWMTAPDHSTPWERALIEKANEGMDSGISSFDITLTSQAALTGAYRECRRLTAHHSRSFYLASALLPLEMQRAMHALYAFCRTADDIVDHPGPDPQAALQALRVQTELENPIQKDPKTPSLPGFRDDLVLLAFADARRRFNIPSGLAVQLLEGVSRDLHPVRFESFEEMTVYAYGVASTVGLMSMHITGFSGRQAVPYAIRLGVALQITNILRDVGEDIRSGRIYLPAEELDHFGIRTDDLVEGRVDDRWRKFMSFQIQRNRRLYEKSLTGIKLLHPDGRLAVAAAADFYAAILDDIEAHDYDVFNHRAHLSAWDKLTRLPGLLWQVRTMDKPASRTNGESSWNRRRLHDLS